MHELGIVYHVIKQVEEVAKNNEVEKVGKITLEVGQVSGVVPEYFKDCFEWYKKKTTYLKECELEIVIIEGITYCQNCKKTVKNELEENETYKLLHPVVCPYCNSRNCTKISGASKVASAAMFGVFSLGKVTKTWHCNSCGSNFG